MFELIRSISIDVEKGRASGEATVPADHPLFADHFPGYPLLPGSLVIELAAQVCGPLAEEYARTTSEDEHWAILGMVRDARFLRPAFLPATLVINAEISRSQPSSISMNVTVTSDDERIMQAELVLMLLEAAPEWSAAIEERNNRLARWKEAS
ncbi:MAG TPA: 3-hydroxyacyl-ACP dehydratase FabZ family protein [Pyrinomonadaceae bacterium]|nr:3-hydroxyacyl-ACP dehydratase FabZ family protein [Pyrinomonadaceae bacterium]